MNRSFHFPALLGLALVLMPRPGRAEPPTFSATVHAQPLHAGRVDPKLFGTFIELLDDIGPALWAEMLNDRSFEGVTKLSDWCYYDGAPDICDREWDAAPGWSLDTTGAFNGQRCARLESTRRTPARLTQSGLAVKKGQDYTCTGYFRTDHPRLAVSVRLKTLLPNGDWFTLAQSKPPPTTENWRKASVQLHSTGESDRVVFEVLAEGEGRLWVDKLSLKPNDNQAGWRRDVVAAVQEVHPALLRFGGSVCDPGEYRWKNGIGDRDLRVPFPNKVWGRLDSNDVGIDEFCQFCELTGTAPLICLSFSDGAANAADLVAYCNGDAHSPWGARRAANGHPAPYRVKYWQIGNEISGDDPHYLQQFNDFVQRMKQSDPSVEILSSYPSTKLFAQSGRELNFVAPHHYTADFAACDRELTQLAQLINGNHDYRHIKIAVTEWNVSGGDWGLMRGKQMTLGTALLNARYLHVLMRHSDKVEIACRSNLANSFCGAILETSPADLLKRPSFYVMQLYARHSLPVPLRLTTNGEGPDLFAANSVEGKSVVVFAVNDRRESVACALRFDGFSSAPSVVRAESLHDTQNARQIDVMNHWATPNRIKISPLTLTPDHREIQLPALSATAIEFTAP